MRVSHLPQGTSDLITRIAANEGARPALLDPTAGLTSSFSSLLATADDRARAFAEAGVRFGETVAVPGVISVSAVADVLACWRVGAAVLPVEPAATEWEMQRRYESARVGWVVSEPGGNVAAVAGREFLPRADDGRALCLTTSGTTGPPKTVGLTARNLAAAAAQMADRLHTSSGEIVLSCLPIFHTAGFVLQLTSGLLHGWTQVCLPRFDAGGAWDLIDEYGVTHTHVAPRMLELLADANRAPRSPMRFISCGAAGLPAPVAEAFERTTGVPVLRGYGMSETGATAHHVAPGEGGGMDVGRAVSGSRTRIVLADGTEAPPGEIGEIQLRGPQVALRYLDGSGSTDGWLHTGDLGVFDETGRLTIAGRAKDVVKYNGHQVFPSELEEIVRTHPAVLDAVVVGRPDAVAGEIPVARVVLKSPVTDQELIDYVGTQVAPYRRIRAVEIVDEIERGAMGKARALRPEAPQDR